MPLPLPKPGDTNVRGFITALLCVCALPSLYGSAGTDSPYLAQQGINPLVFGTVEDFDFPVGAEVLFDVVAVGPVGFATPCAVNVRRA